MLVLTHSLSGTDLPGRAVATIGNFDGLHRGHQAIVRGVIARAGQLGVPSLAVTFDPHPLTIIAPDRAPKQILTTSQKIELLGAMGLDAVLIVPFTHEFSRWTASRFVEELLVQKLSVSEVHIGQDFSFGAGRSGTLSTLTGLGNAHGFVVRGVGDIKVRGIRISSSLVRRSIERGALRATSLALGRRTFIDGRVVTGRRVGRQLGFPTINLEPSNRLFPGAGVYATTVSLDGHSEPFQSVTNIGVRPTISDNNAITIESHILDFDRNVYGDEVRLHFHRLLRREKQFRSPGELVNQIRTDIVRTRQFFGTNPASS